MPSLCAVLQSAAGSVVGRTITAIAKRKGIKTICLVRRREQKQELFNQGYAVVAVCLAPFGLISTEQCLSRMQFEFPVVLPPVCVQQLASAYSLHSSQVAEAFADLMQSRQGNLHSRRGH